MRKSPGVFSVGRIIIGLMVAACAIFVLRGALIAQPAPTTQSKQIEKKAAEAEAKATEAAEVGEEDLGLIDEETYNTLKSMFDYIATFDEFEYQAEVTFDDVMASGQKLQYAGDLNVVMKRPNRIFGTFIGDVGSKTLWYDGETMTIHNSDDDIYAKIDVPDTIDKALDYVMEKYGFALPLDDLLYSDPLDGLLENVDYGFYVGLHDVKGIPCHHLAFTQESIDWQVWIEAGVRPFPRKIVITYNDLPAAPQYTAVLTDWDFDPRPADTAFIANPPDGANWVDVIEIKKEKVEDEEDESEISPDGN